MLLVRMLSISSTVMRLEVDQCMKCTLCVVIGKKMPFSCLRKSVGLIKVVFTYSCSTSHYRVCAWVCVCVCVCLCVCECVCMCMCRCVCVCVFVLLPFVSNCKPKTTEQNSCATPLDNGTNFAGKTFKMVVGKF